MIYSEQIKPLSYVKAHASELISQINKTHEPIVITLNGEAKAVLQSIYTFEEEERNKRDFHKVIDMRMEDYRLGKGVPLDDSLKRLDRKIEKLGKKS